MVKRIRVFCLCLTLIAILTVNVGAVENEVWIDHNGIGEITENGISVNGVEARSLDVIIYNLPLEADKDIIVEITPEYAENKVDEDGWIAVNIMGVPEFLNLSEPAKTPGYAVLFYNFSGLFRMTFDGYQKGIYEGSDSWRLMDKATSLEVGKRNTIELRWNEQDNTHNYLINGIRLDNDNELMMARREIMFPDNEAYIIFASYTTGGDPARYTIHRINETYFGTNPHIPTTPSPSEEESTEPSSYEQSETTSAKFADNIKSDKEDNVFMVIIAILAVLVVISGVIYFLVRKKTKLVRRLIK